MTAADADRDAALPERRPLEILVADDEVMVRQLLVRVLSRRGHRLHEAGNAGEAIHIARSRPLDVALVDDRMPGGGRAVLAALEEDRFAGVMVLMGGALAASGEALPDGARLLRKPFDLARLVEVVED